MQGNDKQVGGTHYQNKTIQPWDAMEAWMSKEAFQGFLQGNAIKYIARWRDKGGVEDLHKAQHYIQKLIESETKPEPKPETEPEPKPEPKPEHQDHYQEHPDYYVYMGV